MTGCTFVLTSDKPCNFLHRLETKQKICDRKQKSLVVVCSQTMFGVVASELKEDRLRVLIYIPNMEIICNFGSGEKIISTRIELVSSSYTASTKTRTSRDLTVEESVLIEMTALRNLQPVGTSLWFHGKEMEDLMLSWRRRMKR